MSEAEEKEKYKRPSWDEYFLNLVQTVRTRGTCDRGRSGCVVTKDNRILVTGYVGSPIGTAHCDDVGHEMSTVTHADGSKTQHCIRTAHNEQNAIANAARFGVALEGSTIYCHMTPCYTCAKIIINAGIRRVVCAKDYHGGERSREIFKEAGVKYDLVKNEMEIYDNM
ncbi:MAG: cytidine/deoxycytidylate deaminase family protein [Parcubacteria group bacterium]|jgi:dCMP deaminase